jgi:hypothetical protein
MGVRESPFGVFRGMRLNYIGYTADSRALEFAIIELFDGAAEISHSFVFYKPALRISHGLVTVMPQGLCVHTLGHRARDRLRSRRHRGLTRAQSL